MTKRDRVRADWHPARSSIPGDLQDAALDHGADLTREGARVLVVEGEPGAGAELVAIVEACRNPRCAAERVSSLAQAMERAGRGDVDIILLDRSFTLANDLSGGAGAEQPAARVPILAVMDSGGESATAVAKDVACDCLDAGDLTPGLLACAVRHAFAHMDDRRARRECEERLVLSGEEARDVLWDWDLRAERISFSSKWRSLIREGGEAGPGSTSATPSDWLDRVHPDDRVELEARLRCHLAGELPAFEHEHRIRDGSGGHRWVIARGRALRDDTGEPVRVVGWLVDVTERRATRERARRGIFHDHLTGFPNRVHFQDLVEQALGRARRHAQYRFAVLILDLDRFKVINDSRGHSVGDELLVAIGRRLERCLRPEDSVARFGGDEFTILLDGIKDASDAVRVAERIREEIAHPVPIEGTDVFSGASIGIAMGSSSYRRAEEIIRDADIAMYRAKAQGRSRFEIFDQEMHAQAVSLLELETDLRLAFERSELRLHYQPIVELSSRRFAGFEALVRWDHPRRGLLLPEVFVPFAEETGLIVPIGRWVMAEAARQMREWRATFGSHRWLSAHVNLTWRELAEERAVEEIEQVLAGTGLEAAGLCLEMTESVVMREPELSRQKLRRLGDMGVRVHIDDFGTGYSSLSVLHEIPADMLKIDRSFVSGANAGNGNREIVRSIVSVARSLGMRVTAEGVETEHQLQRMMTLRCDHGQGFLFHRPASPAETAELIRSSSDG